MEYTKHNSWSKKLVLFWGIGIQVLTFVFWFTFWYFSVGQVKADFQDHKETQKIHEQKVDTAILDIRSFLQEMKAEAHERHMLDSMNNLLLKQSLGVKNSTKKK